MKLFYSSTGINSNIKYDIKDTINNLNDASSNLSSSPSDFQYASFINNLGDTLNNYKKRLDRLNTTSIQIDNKYVEVLNDSKKVINNVDDPNIKERLSFKNLDVTLQNKGYSSTILKSHLTSSDKIKDMLKTNIADENSTRGIYQGDNSTIVDSVKANVADENSTRGIYQGDNSTIVDTVKANVADENSTRGIYQKDNSTTVDTVKANVVDENSTRGIYQE